MSTLKKNVTAKRFVQLSLFAAQGEVLFHIQDLSNLWGIRDPNTLRVTLNRYVKSGLLHSIYRGFYSLLPIEKLDPIDLGSKAIHGFCYLSTETVLYQEGYMNQVSSVYTFVSELSLHFSIGPYVYKSRQLKDTFLYQSKGLFLEGNHHRASAERAIVELLYFNPYVSFDKPVNWKEIKRLQIEFSYPLTPHRYAVT